MVECVYFEFYKFFCLYWYRYVWNCLKCKYLCEDKIVLYCMIKYICLYIVSMVK